MTIRTALWLFSYVGVSLALAVGNRIENPAESPSKGDNTRVKLESDKNQIKNNLHLRAHQYDGSRRDNAVHDWLMYDELQPVISPGGGGGGGGGLQVGDNEMRRYRDVVFDEMSQPLMARRNPLPFIYEEALFQQQQHHARKRPGGFKQSKKVVGLPPLVYGGTEEETPPGPGQPDPDRSNLEDLYDHDSRGTVMSFDNMGGLPFEPPDSPHKPQGGGIGLSPLLFETEKPPGKRTAVATSGQGAAAQLPSPPGGAAIASQFMLRSARGNRQYDVPQIGEFNFINVRVRD